MAYGLSYKHEDSTGKEAPEDESLQAALTAQIRKSEYKGTQAKNLSGPKPIIVFKLQGSYVWTRSQTPSQDTAPSRGRAGIDQTPLRRPKRSLDILTQLRRSVTQLRRSVTQ